MFRKNPRCQIVPLEDDKVAFSIDGRERLRWHAGKNAPRPYFYPLIGPSGLPLTRMGHPGDPSHDHHRSIWFAYHKVLGINFWGDTSDAVIRQQRWLAYQDGEDESQMAVELAWLDGHDPAPLIKQEVVVAVQPGDVAVQPGDRDETFVELQTSLWSVADSLELGQTNFGLLAVRVAQAISAVFGDGVLTGASGERTEAQLFGKPSAWIDYSGSIDTDVVEGITYFDHPDNATFPSKWHVRDDGWMGASIGRDAPVMLRHDAPTTYRYLLHAHRGPVDLAVAARIQDEFAKRPKLRVRKSPKPHHQFEIDREMS